MSKETFRVIKLEYPKTIGDREISEVALRRMTAGEVQAYIKEVLASPENPPRLPIMDITPEQFDQLDDDDAATIDEAITDFLPRRLQKVAEKATESPSASTPAPVEPISPSSPQSSPASAIREGSIGTT